MGTTVVRRHNGFRALGRALLARGGYGVFRRLGAVPRMLGGRFRGRYRELSWPRLVAIAVGVAYVVSPVDLVPESVLLALGLVDDGVVLAWVAGAILDESERFLTWEDRPSPPSVPEPATPAPPPAGPPPRRTP